MLKAVTKRAPCSLVVFKPIGSCLVAPSSCRLGLPLRRLETVLTLEQKYLELEKYPVTSNNGLFDFLQIYTDWANHYLEKAKCKRRIRDLQADVADGVLLADVVEAVSKYLLNHTAYQYNHF